MGVSEDQGSGWLALDPSEADAEVAPDAEEHLPPRPKSSCPSPASIPKFGIRRVRPVERLSVTNDQFNELKSLLLRSHAALNRTCELLGRNYELLKRNNDRLRRGSDRLQRINDEHSARFGRTTEPKYSS